MTDQKTIVFPPRLFSLSLRSLVSKSKHFWSFQFTHQFHCHYRWYFLQKILWRSYQNGTFWSCSWCLTGTSRCRGCKIRSLSTCPALWRSGDLSCGRMRLDWTFDRGNGQTDHLVAMGAAAPGTNSSSRQTSWTARCGAKLRWTALLKSGKTTPPVRWEKSGANRATAKSKSVDKKFRW